MSSLCHSRPQVVKPCYDWKSTLSRLFAAKEPRMNTLRHVLLTLLAVVLLVMPLTADENWPQFRGPGARGVAGSAPSLPDRWSDTENVAWKTDIPGRGWSSPIVWGNQVFLTTVINEGETEEPKKGLYFGGNRPTPPQATHQWLVLCLNLDSGQVVWQQLVHEGAPNTPIHLKNSFASETPVTDGRRLYVYFGGVGVYCFDLDGELQWSKPITPRKMRYGWGTAASPIIDDQHVYLVNDNDDDSFLLALDKRTGKEAWRVERDEASNWATPFLWHHAQGSEIVTAGTQKVRSYDRDGNLLWTLQGMSSITIATPYAYNGLLYVSSGYVLDRSKPLYAIRPGAQDDISLAKAQDSNDWIEWQQPMAAPYNPSTLAYDGVIYVLYDRGFFSTFDASTGANVYPKQRIPQGRAFTSSPWAYDDKIFCLNEDGVTFVIKAGPDFQLLHKNLLAEDDMAMATPAISGDRLLIRTSARVYCIRKLNDFP